MAQSRPNGQQSQAQPGASQPPRQLQPQLQPRHQPQPDTATSMLSVAHSTSLSTYQQALCLLPHLQPTPFLTAEERILYMLDVIRGAAWQADSDQKFGQQRRTEPEAGIVGTGPVGQVTRKHIRLAMAVLGSPMEWKARRREWELFAKTYMGIDVVEKVMTSSAGTLGGSAGAVEMAGKPPAQMCQMATSRAAPPTPVSSPPSRPVALPVVRAVRPAASSFANVRVGGGNQAAGCGEYKEGGQAGLPVSDRRDDDIGALKGGSGRIEEAKEDQDNDEEDDDDETERVSWEEIVEELESLDQEMRAKGGVSNSPLLRDLLNLVEVRLDDMKEVFVPLVSRITNTLMDVTGVEQKLTAMEVNGAGIFSRDDGMNGSSEGGSEADYTLSLFLVEFKSLLANLHALQKTFREHSILSYLSPFHSTVERLNSIEEMLLEEIELKTMTGKSSEVNEELLAKFQRVMKTWDTLGKMYEMDLKFANLRL